MIVPGLVGVSTVQGQEQLHTPLNHASIITAWYSPQSGVAGSAWSPVLGANALTINGSPATVQVNGLDVWDLDQIDDYFSHSVSEGSAAAILAMVRSDEASFSGQNGIAGPVSGGAVGLTGQASSDRLNRFGSLGQNVGWASKPVQWQARDYLPQTGVLIPTYSTGVYATLNLATGLQAGIDRSNLGRLWNGRFADFIIYSTTPSSGQLARDIGYFAHLYATTGDIHSNNEWKLAPPTVAPATAGQALIDEAPSIEWRSTRNGDRKSAYVSILEDVEQDLSDLKQAAGLQLVTSFKGATLINDSRLTNWTDTGAVTVPSDEGDGVYRFTVTGTGNLAYAVAFLSGSRNARCQVRLASGAIPTGSELTFTDGGSQAGVGFQLDSIGANWTDAQATVTGQSDGLRFDFPNVTNATIEVRYIRALDNYTVSTPAFPVGSTVGASYGSDSLFAAQVAWPTEGTLAIAFKPYGGWSGAGVPLPGMRFYSIGDWNAVGAVDPVLTNNGGSSSITLTGESVADEWEILFLDYNGTDVGAQWGASTRQTVAETAKPSGSLFLGNETAANNFHGAMWCGLYDRILTNPERLELRDTIIASLTDASLEEL